jgi:hypothetical protein
MARVDIALADQVKRYASLHRQPISVVIRDGLTLLMEEYPSAADRSVPQRLAAHEFLSDRYESPLDTLIGETDSTEREALLSDTNEAMIEALLPDTSGEDEYVSDTKGAVTDITSDKNKTGAAMAPETPARGRPRKVSDRKETSAASTPESPASSFVSDTNMPTYDTDKYYLGKLCQRHHDYHGTGQSLLRKTNHLCLACDRERAKERRQVKNAVAHASRDEQRQRESVS